MKFENKTIDWLYNEQLRVDHKWSIRTQTGFKWWGHEYAQTVEVLGECVAEEDHLYLVGVRTQVASQVPPGARTEEFLNTAWMPFASMSGLVLDPQGHLFLSSAVWVYDGIRGWMDPLISMAAALQLHDAPALANWTAAELGARPEVSAHPKSGSRTEGDEITEVAPLLVIPKGQEPSPWQREEFEATVQNYMMRPPSLGATSGGLGFTVEFPYGEQSSLMTAVADDAHPIYGNGLLLRQSFPVDVDGEGGGARLALKLNQEEQMSQPTGYGFGSYCYAKGCIHFVTFLPNVSYKPGLLPNLYFSGASRARAMSERFTGNGW